MSEDFTQEDFEAAASKAYEDKRPCIAIFQDPDGNWRGGTEKFGKFVNVRDVGPETVLQLLLTHDGK